MAKFSLGGPLGGKKTFVRAVTEAITEMPGKGYSVQEPSNQRQNSIAKVARTALQSQILGVKTSSDEGPTNAT